MTPAKAPRPTPAKTPPVNNNPAITQIIASALFPTRLYKLVKPCQYCLPIMPPINSPQYKQHNTIDKASESAYDFELPLVHSQT
ncbi:hypothetical protein KDA_00640 [Dictyobacter alpinus]|uniref:Uncharacterized protein n=1 Tax=Dictyobacter alpinus TaxID=2014873 RepID=A0A402AZP7_9CHLR|nr:hypothetical protein KDA_00640 [Dictyobacter alpinus]